MSKPAICESVRRLGFLLATFVSFQGVQSVAFAGDESHSDLSNSNSESSTDSNVDKERVVVVTAQKREERLQDVPIPVAVVDAEALTENNEVRMRDYYTEVPGLSIAPGSLGGENLSIRGISTGSIGTTSTVGIMIDDIPFGPTGSQQIPDLDPGDLARIEVLRGPQGTLYGVSSMGGLVKFVTKDPSGDQVEGRVEAGTDSVQNGVDLGYITRGSISAPIAEGLSVRASAYDRRDAGFIDNPVYNINGVNYPFSNGTHDGINQAYATGARLAALWRPDDGYSLKLSALYQRLRANATGDLTIDQGLRDLQVNSIFNSTGYDRTIQAYSAISAAKFGTIDFVSATGFNVSTVHEGDDASWSAGALSSASFGVPGAPSLSFGRSAKFNQEFRLNFPMGTHFDGLLGLFYTHEHNMGAQAILGTDPQTGQAYGVGYYAPVTSTATESAIFADLTYHVIGNFDIQLGLRQSSQKEAVDQVATYVTGAYLTAYYGSTTVSPVITPAFDFTSHPLTYLFSPQYKLSQNAMVYARLASGYRTGGSNAGTPDVPQEYGPDKTKNYEIGTKFSMLSGALSVDASLYYIDWDQIQVGLIAPNQYLYTGNAGGAKSQGFELAVDAKPVRGMQLSAWGTWTEAKITTLPSNLTSGSPLAGQIGQPLPWSPRFSAHLSITQDFALGTFGNLFVGGGISYVGNREDQFTGLDPTTGLLAYRQDLPAYATTDFRVGVKSSSWNASLYINNATNRRGWISGGNSSSNLPPGAVYITTPRTVGISIVRDF